MGLSLEAMESRARLLFVAFILGIIFLSLANSEGSDTPTNLLYQYQTLIAGMLAILSVGGLVWQTKSMLEHAKTTELERQKNEQRAIARSLLAEMTLNRLQLSNLIDNQGYYYSVLTAENEGRRHPLKMSRDVYNEVLKEIGILGSDCAQRVIACYNRVDGNLATLFMLAEDYIEDFVQVIIDDKVSFEASERALDFLDNFCKDVFAMDIAIESLAALDDIEIHPDIMANLEQRDKKPPGEAMYIPDWKQVSED